MNTITEGLPNFKTFEKEIFGTMCGIACELARQYLELQDVSLMGTRDTGEYRLVGFRKTTIKTLFGEVTYSRRYYRKRDGGYVCLLDEAMGIGGCFGLVSENLAELLVNECADKSYRKASASIGAATGQGISAMGAWNVVQKYGEAIGRQEKRLEELAEAGSTGHLGGVSAKVLFEEHDDVWISRQRKKRRKAGTAAQGAKKIGKKPGKLPMHVSIAYTGWKRSNDGRHNAANKIAYASFGKPATFRVKFGTLLSQRFDMDGVERRITNGDGEAWIRTAAEENDTILQLDPFHRSQAIIRAVKDKSDRELLFEAIDEKDVDKTLSTICELALDTRDETEKEKLSKLYGYFRSNRDILLSWQERGVELPAPPAGISYREMGLQESSNCLITQRMKNRRASWSEDGANNMAKILCLRGTIGLDTFLGSLPELTPYVGTGAEPLSAAKAPLHDGKGYWADGLHAPMPFEGAFRTNGREAIRRMLRLRPLPSAAILQGS